MFFLDVPSPHVVANVKPVKLVTNLSQGCPAPRAVREVQSAQPPVDPPVAPEEPTEQPTAEPMGLRQRRGKGRRNGMCTDVLESPVSNISRECKLSRRTPQALRLQFDHFWKLRNLWMNQWTNLFPLVRSYKEPPSCFFTAFVRLWVERHTINTRKRLLVHCLWFVCVGNVCGGSSTPEDDDDAEEEVGVDSFFTIFNTALAGFQMWEGLQWTLKKFHGYIPWPRIFFDIDCLHRQPQSKWIFSVPSGKWLDSSLPGALCRQRNERRWAASWCWPQASVTTKTSCELSQMHQDAPGFWIKASLGLTIVSRVSRSVEMEVRLLVAACCSLYCFEPTKLLLFIHSFAICWQPDKWQVLVQSPSLPWPGPQNQCHWYNAAYWLVYIHI